MMTIRMVARMAGAAFMLCLLGLGGCSRPEPPAPASDTLLSAQDLSSLPPLQTRVQGAVMFQDVALVELLTMLQQPGMRFAVHGKVSSATVTINQNQPTLADILVQVADQVPLRFMHGEDTNGIVVRVLPADHREQQ